MFYPTFFFSINSTYMKQILHFENVTPKSSYNWLKIRGFFQSGEGTWREFLWGGGTKLELRYWVRIVIINQIPPGGGTANLKSRNLSRKKVSCTTILQSTWRGHFCSSQPSIVHWLSSSIFPCWLFGCSSRNGDIWPNLTSTCPTPPNPYIFWKLTIIAIQ